MSRNENFSEKFQPFEKPISEDDSGSESENSNVPGKRKCQSSIPDSKRLCVEESTKTISIDDSGLEAGPSNSNYVAKPRQQRKPRVRKSAKASEPATDDSSVVIVDAASVDGLGSGAGRSGSVNVAKPRRERKPRKPRSAEASGPGTDNQSDLISTAVSVDDSDPGAGPSNCSYSAKPRRQRKPRARKSVKPSESGTDNPSVVTCGGLGSGPFSSHAASSALAINKNLGDLDQESVKTSKNCEHHEPEVENLSDSREEARASEDSDVPGPLSADNKQPVSTLSRSSWKIVGESQSESANVKGNDDDGSAASRFNKRNNRVVPLRRCSELIVGQKYKVISILRTNTQYGSAIRALIYDDHSSTGNSFLYLPVRFRDMTDSDLAELNAAANSPSGLYLVYKGRIGRADIIELC